LIKCIKKHNEHTPVIFMSARNEELDRVIGLELGSEDYLSKPFLPRELVIRVNKLMKRIYSSGDNPKNNGERFYIGAYEIVRNLRVVFTKGNEISLTRQEFDLLLCFADNPNSLLSREKILDIVWGQDYFGSDRVVDDTIRRLRKKLENISIETVYGLGYKLVVKE